MLSQGALLTTGLSKVDFYRRARYAAGTNSKDELVPAQQWRVTKLSHLFQTLTFSMRSSLTQAKYVLLLD
jgi:hypothetical protein